MRLWSLHPSYLDSAGLVALWREGLLARKVLSGNTRGYRNHPQLERFKHHPDPVDLLDGYLTCVYEEAIRRGFRFNKDKIHCHDLTRYLPLPGGQLDYEFRHLMDKLKFRTPHQWFKLREISVVQPHPLFYIIEGSVCDWEIIDRSRSS